jgi:hypothetical protein
VPEKNCFVICPFGTPDSTTRKRSDMVLEYLIGPALAGSGMAITRADLAAQPGIVTVHVIQHLIEDELVIADISDRNPNVFYELAIRHAIRKPFIQIIEDGQTIPFNIQDIQTVIYDTTNVNRIKSAVQMIQKQLIWYSAGGKVTSPVTVAIDALIGTRTLAQFSELMQKVADLDNSIAQTAGLKNTLEEMRAQLQVVADKLQSAQPVGHTDNRDQSNNKSRNRNRDAEDVYSSRADSVVRQRNPTKEYSVGEWLDLHNKGKV